MPSFFIGAVASLFNHSCQIIPASKKIFAQLLIFDVSCASILANEFYPMGGYQYGNYMEAFCAGTAPQRNRR